MRSWQREEAGRESTKLPECLVKERRNRNQRRIYSAARSSRHLSDVWIEARRHQSWVELEANAIFDEISQVPAGTYCSNVVK